MAEVNLENVEKRFGETWAVAGIDLTVHDQEFVILVGPSGCGKTTTLRMIAGLEDVSAGDIRIGGRSVVNLPPRDRDIAMVFQSYALYPHMDVYRNMAFSLQLRRVPKKEIDRRVNEVAEILGLTPQLKRKPRQLSGGQRQRVAVGAALCRQSGVLLFDEPLSNLDAKLRASAREELERFHRRVGTTTIYVTHDQVEAMAMGDRVMVLNKGVVRQLGTPTDVYDNPADTFVATFLGSPPMNLAELGDVIVGFRPEHFQPAPTITDPVVPFRFKVENIEYLGSEWVVSGTLVGGKLEGKKVFSRLSSAQNLQLGGMYDFAVPQSHLKFFDRSSEKRVAPRAVSWQ